MITIRFVFLYGALWSLGCSSESKFKGSNKEIEKSESNSSPQSTPSPTPAPAPTPSQAPTPLACTAPLNYDPSEILCELKESAHVTIWDKVIGWSQLVQNLQNKDASWISPLAPTSSVVNGETAQSCPYLKEVDKLIYVSHFELENDETISLEAIIDNIGQVRIWKSGDAGQEVYISPQSNQAKASVNLGKGFYTIVIDGIDTGGGASGVIGTFFHSNGQIINQTEKSADWCIFRVTASTDIKTFVHSAAICRRCMMGSKVVQDGT